MKLLCLQCGNGSDGMRANTKVDPATAQAKGDGLDLGSSNEERMTRVVG